MLHLPSILERTIPSVRSAKESTLASRGNVFTCKIWSAYVLGVQGEAKTGTHFNRAPE
jgi:hypothetical protein